MPTFGIYLIYIPTLMVNPYGFHVGYIYQSHGSYGNFIEPISGPRGLEIPLSATVSFKENVLTFIYFRDYENTPIIPQFPPL